MFIAVCKYVISPVAVLSVILVGRVICGMKLLDRIFSRNWFTPVFCMYLMGFRLKFPVMIERFFSNVSFSSTVVMKLLLNL